MRDKRQLNIKFVSDRPQPHISFEREELDKIPFETLNTLDLETTGLVFNKNVILLVIVGNREVQYVIDYNFVDKSLLYEGLKKMSTVIGHNLSFDLPFLISRGGYFELDTIYDTMETELTLVKGTKHSVSLQNTVERRLGLKTFDKGITKEFTLMSATNPYFEDRHISYAAEDVLYLEDVKDVQMSLVRRYKQEKLVNTNNNMVLVVSHMKVDGIKLDVEKWMGLYYENLKKIDEYELLLDKELERLGLVQRRKRVKQRTVQLDILGGSTDVENKNLDNINYGSPDQIKQIFRHFKQPIPKVMLADHIEKETTGAPELEEFILNRPNSILIPFLKLLLQYKVLKKQASTYGKKFIEEHLGVDGKVHPSYKVNRTATGRLASADPNAQNIPQLTSFRSCFVAEEGNELETRDLSSAELRILASLANDEAMKKLYRNGEDLHSYLATPVWRYLKNEPNTTVTKKTHPEFRNQMKTINFGIAFGASAHKVSKVLGISKKQGEKVLEIMKSTIPNAFEYLESQREKGMTVGKIKFDDKWNQVRYFEEVIKNDPTITQKRLAGIGRESMNCALQGINSQMIKVTMVDTFRYIRANNLKAKMVLSVHDELVIERPKEEEVHSDAFEAIMIESANYFLDGVEMEVEKNIGKVWNK